MNETDEQVERAMKAFKREREAFVAKLALQREAIRVLLKDHIRRYIAASGVSYPLQTPKGHRREPSYTTDRLDVIDLLQRECDTLDKAGEPDSRYDSTINKGTQ